MQITEYLATTEETQCFFSQMYDCVSVYEIMGLVTCNMRLIQVK